jgi:hypothetical protein
VLVKYSKLYILHTAFIIILIIQLMIQKFIPYMYVSLLLSRTYWISFILSFFICVFFVLLVLMVFLWSMFLILVFNHKDILFRRHPFPSLHHFLSVLLFLVFLCKGKEDHFNQCSLQCRCHAAPDIGYYVAVANVGLLSKEILFFLLTFFHSIYLGDAGNLLQ